MRPFTPEELRWFLAALRSVNQGFDILCEQSNIGTGITRMREFFSAMPPTGPTGQTAVLRRYVINKALAHGESDVAEAASRWTDDEIMSLVLAKQFPMP